LPEKINAPQAVILVGGPGTRLQPLTYSIPKPMMPVVNRPFLEHTIAYLKQYGIDDIILALSYLPEVIRQYFGEGSTTGVKLTYCMEKTPLGTCGAVKNAEQHLNRTCIVLNGDIFTDLDLSSMIDFHRAKKSKVTIALKQVEDVSGLGVVEIDSTGRIERFVEKPKPGETASKQINAGIYLIEPEALAYAPSNSHYMFEKGLFPLLIERGEPVYGFQFEGYWMDMGNPLKYLSLNSDLLLSKAKSPLISHPADKVTCERGAEIHPSVRMTAPVIVAEGCRVGEGTVIKGPSVLGANCQIGNNAIIDTAVLLENARIGDSARVSNSIIGRNTVIKPGDKVINCVVTAEETKSLPL
jgi:mannose-1-phosphate guanylyltransferase